MKHPVNVGVLRAEPADVPQLSVKRSRRQRSLPVHRPLLLLEEVLRRDNLLRALKRVHTNRGGPGVDGQTVDQLVEYLKQEWPYIRRQLLSGNYTPRPVRVVKIPKGNGGERTLGIPTVLDRLIQQAITQVISPIFEPHFSDDSYGFRPGRSAHQALKRTCEHIEEGCRWVVDLDLENFFDRVHHDILMSRIARRIEDKRLLKLIRKYLEASAMEGGVASPRTQGTPQGSPLSPLMSNILLDDLDKELERRGHRFCRYADDCTIYVRSRRAAERVMASITKYLERKLKLKVNRDKSAVARPWKRKFLGYTVTNNLKPKLKPAPASIQRMKDRIRAIIQRGKGRNIRTVIEEINRFTRGWRSYFRLSGVKGIFQQVNQWIRHHLRKILWIQWKHPITRRRKMIQLGVYPERARKAAAGGRGPWWNSSASHMHAAVPNRLLKKWGLHSL